MIDRKGQLIIISVSCFVLLTSVLPVPSRADSDSSPDTTRSNRWSVLYRNQIELSRVSEPFPWNDEEARAHMHDRLVLMAELEPLRFLTTFLKGATGFRRDDVESHRNQFNLEQAHMAFRIHHESLTGRLFLRERIYRSSFRLLPLLSNDAPFIEGRGEGLQVAYEGFPWIGATYIESILRADDDIGDYGGFPTFRGGGDVFRLFQCRLKGGERLDLGLALSQTRSVRYGDAVMVGASLGIRVFGMGLIGELARTREGQWSDLAESSLLGIEPRKLKLTEFSSLFNENVAFSAELDGLVTRSPTFGEFGFVPGYRFYGNAFFNPQGEITDGLAESYLTTWWRHPRYEAMVVLEAADGSNGSSGEDYSWFEGLLRFRFKGGLEVRNGFLAQRGDRPSLILSLLDESSNSRVLTTARLDDVGEGNDFSFLTEGGINLTSTITARTALYLYRSARSFYALELEFRPRERFLFKAGFGSFVPFDEDVMLNQNYDLVAPPEKERMISIFTRIWFGGVSSS